MAKSQKQRWAEIHAEALAEFDDIQSAQQETREQCRADRRFYSVPGAQWEGGLGDQFENRPRYEFNRVHLAVLRIINEYRNNRISVDFTSKDGQEGDTLADTCDGLYRADEQYSNAQEAYDTAFTEATSGGIGAFRLRCCYEDEMDDDNDAQRVVIEPIHDADSTVFFDLGCMREDKSDAKRCYVLSPYTYAQYEAEFGEDPATWPKEINETEFDWCPKDKVWVAERYEVQERSEMVYTYQSKVGGLLGGEPEERKFTEAELEEEPGLRADLEASGFVLVREKRAKRRQIVKHTMSGAGILSEEEIPGEHIPVVMAFGQREVVDGVERAMGHVRLAKDAQRLVNMLMSWLAEIAARFDIEKPILTPEQVAGHAMQWAADAVERYPYLLVNPITDAEGRTMPAGPIGYTKAPMVPPAMAALLQLATEALNDLLGAQQAGEQLQPNQSGKAVELIQQRLDMQVFIYMDNFRKAIRRAGEVWLSMKRAITVEPSRRMKTIAIDGKPGSVVVNEPRVKDGREYIENDISKATFDVVADVGPSSSSQRSATVRALTQLAAISADPEIQRALTFATLSQIEGNGLDGVHDWARKMGLQIGIIKPTEEEAAEMAQAAQQRQPDAQSTFLMAEAKKSEANAVLALAKTEQAQAETAATLAGIDSDQQKQVIETVKAIDQITKPQPLPSQGGGNP